MPETNQQLKKRNNLLGKKADTKRGSLITKAQNQYLGDMVAKLNDLEKAVNDSKTEVNFPKTQEVSGTVDLKDKSLKVDNFPKIQLVKINKPKPYPKKISVSNLPKVQKVEVVKQDPYPKIISVDNLPTAEGQDASKKADPTKYLPIRITNGKIFVDNFGGGGGAMVSGRGSSLPETWTTTSGSSNISSSLLLASNDMRKFAVFTNDSANPVYLSFGDVAEVGGGIRLNSNGGAYEIGTTNMFKGNVFAISTTEANNVCILEVYKKVI